MAWAELGRRTRAQKAMAKRKGQVQVKGQENRGGDKDYCNGRDNVRNIDDGKERDRTQRGQREGWKTATVTEKVPGGEIKI